MGSKNLLMDSKQKKSEIDVVVSKVKKSGTSFYWAMRFVENDVSVRRVTLPLQLVADPVEILRLVPQNFFEMDKYSLQNSQDGC